MSMSPENSAVVIKGHGTGVRLIIPTDLALDEALNQAVRVVSEAESVIKQMTIIVDTGARPLDSAVLLRVLQEIIWPMDLSISFWRSEHQEALAFLRRSGFRVEDERRGEKELLIERSEKTDGEPLVVNQTLRSGQKIVHSGDVLILGDVHSGAEVMASGNVCVFGRLSGVAHAGCDGDERRFIAVDSFKARQVRIGRKVSNDLNSSEQLWWGGAVIVSIDRDAFVVTERR
ncbi:MAG: septum site-determining protein MinC [Dethiosulfovibrio peptidovorans]|nr:MAG: septum site-determining protein MinC [Dethiosulfovibrio peptidovorans]